MSNVFDIESARSRRSLPVIAERPKTRGDCVDGERPCPWVSCRHHLALSVTQHFASSDPRLVEEFGSTEIDEWPATCALDIADRGGASLEDIATSLNLTRERVRQIVEKAIVRIRGRRGRAKALLEEIAGAPMPSPDEKPHLEIQTTYRYETSHRLEPQGAEPTETDDADDGGLGVRGAWRLFEDDAMQVPAPETKARLDAACSGVWRAYMNASIADGHELGAADPKFTERLARVEEHLARTTKEKPEETTMAQAITTTVEQADRQDQIIELIQVHGPMNPKRMGDLLRISAQLAGTAMRELLALKRLVHNGKGGQSTLYGVPGTDFNAGHGDRNTMPAKPKRSIADVAAKHTTVVALKVSDVHITPLRGFTVRVNGLDVECPTAAHVRELAREFAS